MGGRIIDVHEQAFLLFAYLFAYLSDKV